MSSCFILYCWLLLYKIQPWHEQPTVFILNIYIVHRESGCLFNMNFIENIHPCQKWRKLRVVHFVLSWFLEALFVVLLSYIEKESLVIVNLRVKGKYPFWGPFSSKNVFFTICPYVYTTLERKLTKFAINESTNPK